MSAPQTLGFDPFFRPSATWSYWLCFAVLLVAGCLIINGELLPRKHTFYVSLKSCLPQQEELSSWSVSYLPLADTPEAQEAVKKILNYNDAVYAIYTSRDTHISVYAAYWRPDRMPYRVVASHTPDACWIESGWRCKFREETKTLTGTAGHILPTAQIRTFMQNDRTEHVVFWHLIGRNTLLYVGPKSQPTWSAFITDLFSLGLRQRDEQFFLRISSNQPLAKLWETPVVKSIIQRFPGFEISVDLRR